MVIQIQKIKPLLVLCWLVIALSSCLEGGASSVCEQSSVKREFRLPTIPQLITDKADRVEYLAAHYWDEYNFRDTLLVQNDSIRGVAVAGYITLLETLQDGTEVAHSISNSLDRSLAAGGLAFDLFVGTLEDYLYNPNSPMRNEELYIPVLHYVVDAEDIAEVDKLRARYQLKMALKNRVGAIATDFEYITKRGKMQTLHSTAAQYILLFFNNPDCEECARLKQEIASEPLLNSLYRSGTLKILAIDAESDIDLWREASYPKLMINGYDNQHTILSNSLYDLKALPTLYLLGGDKTILLKDCTIAAAIVRLSQELVIFDTPL